MDALKDKEDTYKIDLATEVLELIDQEEMDENLEQSDENGSEPKMDITLAETHVEKINEIEDTRTHFHVKDALKEDKQNRASCNSSSIDWFEIGDNDNCVKDDPNIEMENHCTETEDDPNAEMKEVEEAENTDCEAFHKQQKISIYKAKGGLTWFLYETKETPTVKAEFVRVLIESTEASKHLELLRKELVRCKVKADQMKVLCELQSDAVKWEAAELDNQCVKMNIMEYKVKKRNQTVFEEGWDQKINLAKDNYSKMYNNRDKLSNVRNQYGLMFRHHKKELNSVLRQKKRELREQCHTVNQNDIKRKRSQQWMKQLEEKKEIMARKEEALREKGKAEQIRKKVEARGKLKEHGELMQCLEIENSELMKTIKDTKTDIDFYREEETALKCTKEKIHDDVKKLKNDRKGYQKKLLTIQKKIVAKNNLNADGKKNYLR